MRIVVYGAGAVGGVIAARLHLAGVDVQAVARGPHLDAVRRDGLRLVTPHGEDVVRLPAAASLADLDVTADTAVLVTVKSHQTSGVMGDLAAHTPPDVTVVSAQNGVANEEALQRTRAHVLGMVVMLPSSHVEPGVVVQASRRLPGLLDVGSFPAGVDDRAEGVAEALRAAGFESVVRPDIMAWKYRKLMMSVGNAAYAACAAGEDREWLVDLAHDEAERVVAAAGIPMVSDETDVARRGDLLDTQSMRGRGGGSTWQSLHRRTGTVEVDYFNGEISMLGRRVGIPTPVNDLLRVVAWRLAAERAEPGTLSAADLMEDLHP